MLLKLSCWIPKFDSTQPLSGQMNFQRPATQTMSYLIDLHHDIYAVLLLVCVLVFYWLVQVAKKFRSADASSVNVNLASKFDGRIAVLIGWTSIVALFCLPLMTLIWHNSCFCAEVNGISVTSGTDGVTCMATKPYFCVLEASCRTDRVH
jgi:heme/copper-type cytochrome/quinol oxidase subunit 2